MKMHSILIVADEELILKQMQFALEDFFDNIFSPELEKQKEYFS